MAFRDQGRRPLVLVLLVIVPVWVVVWSVAITQATPRLIGLPGGAQITTTMKALHGPGMASLTVAFVAALVGVFVMQSALKGDRRLVIAGFRPGETVIARLVVLGAATLLVVVVATGATALSFTPVSWPELFLSLLLIGGIYAALGALAGALLEMLAATYLILFLALTDGIVQTPMFHPTPGRWAVLLPGYAPTRILIESAFSPQFHTGSALLLALAWAVGLASAVYIVLSRAIGVKA